MDQILVGNNLGQNNLHFIERIFCDLVVGRHTHSIKSRETPCSVEVLDRNKKQTKKTLAIL